MRLITDFIVFGKKEKLRILCRKVTADFLQNTRTFMEIELSKMPVSMTYNQVLYNYRNEVSRKFPLDMSQSNHRGRKISEFIAVSGRGRGSRHSGRGKVSGGRVHPKVRWFTGTDSKLYEVHVSYKFQDHV